MCRHQTSLWNLFSSPECFQKPYRLHAGLTQGTFHGRNGRLILRGFLRVIKACDDHILRHLIFIVIEILNDKHRHGIVGTHNRIRHRMRFQILLYHIRRLHIELSIADMIPLKLNSFLLQSTAVCRLSLLGFFVALKSGHKIDIAAVMLTDQMQYHFLHTDRIIISDLVTAIVHIIDIDHRHICFCCTANDLSCHIRTQYLSQNDHTVKNMIIRKLIDRTLALGDIIRYTSLLIRRLFHQTVIHQYIVVLHLRFPN